MHDKGFFFPSSLNNVLTLYTQTSEVIFYKLFSVHFQNHRENLFEYQTTFTVVIVSCVLLTLTFYSVVILS